MGTTKRKEIPYWVLISILTAVLSGIVLYIGFIIGMGMWYEKELNEQSNRILPIILSVINLPTLPIWLLASRINSEIIEVFLSIFALVLNGYLWVLIYKFIKMLFKK